MNLAAAMERVGWKAEQTAATSLEDAIAKGNTHVSDNWEALVSHPQVEIIVAKAGRRDRRE